MIKQQLVIAFVGMGLIVSPISISKCYQESRVDPTIYSTPQICVTSAYEQRIDYRLYMNDEINQLDKSDRKQWYINYKSIQEKYKEHCPIDETKSIHSVTTSAEFDLLARLVEAEIGGGDFNAKCNVASTIINRYRMYAPTTWYNVVYEKNQYTPIWDGRCKKAIASEDSKLALEYVYEIGDTTNGAIYFHSGRSKWHETASKIQFTMKDNWHKFYRLK